MSDLPPDARTLERARRSGNLPQAPAALALAALAALALALAVAIPALHSALEHLVQHTWSALAQPPSLEDYGSHRVLRTLLPLLLAPFTAVLVAGVLRNRFYLGTPQVQRSWLRPQLPLLRPARLLATRASTMLVALTLLATSIAVLLDILPGLGALVGEPPARLAQRLARMTTRALWLTLGIAALAALAETLFRHLLWWRSLFRSHSQARREAREQSAPPELADARRRQARSALTAARLDPEDAIALVTDATTRTAVLLAWRPPEVDPPHLAAVGRGQRFDALLASCHANALPVLDDPPLARELARSVAAGHPLPERLYDPLAELFASHGVGVPDSSAP